MRPLILVAIAAAFVSSVGCASTIASGPDWVPINSTPQGAEIRLDGIRVGKTPTVLPIARSSDGVLEFDLPGYEPLRRDLDKVLNGWFVGNFLWGWFFPVGMIVDIFSSSAGKYSTDPVHVELTPKTDRRKP